MLSIFMLIARCLMWQSGKVALWQTIYRRPSFISAPRLTILCLSIVRPSYTSNTLPKVIPKAGQKQSQPGTNIFPPWD